MTGGSQFDRFLGYWSKSIPWIHVDFLFIFITLYLGFYFPLNTVPSIVFASRSQSCDGYVTLFIYTYNPANLHGKTEHSGHSTFICRFRKLPIPRIREIAE